MTCYQILTLIISVIVAVVVIYQLFIITKHQKENIEVAKCRTGYDLINSYNLPEFSQRRKEIENKKDKQSAIYLLNFFEQVAIAVNEKLVNEDICKKFFRTIFKGYLVGDEIVKNEYQKAIDEDIEHYSNLKKTLEKWEIK